MPFVQQYGSASAPRREGVRLVDVAGVRKDTFSTAVPPSRRSTGTMIPTPPCITSPSCTQSQRASNSSTTVGRTASHAAPGSPSRAMVLRENASGVPIIQAP